METTKTPCGQEYDEEICPIRHKTQLDLRSQGRRVQFPRCITCPFMTKSAYKESVVIPASQPEKPVKNENLPEKQEKPKPMPKKEKPAEPASKCIEPDCKNLVTKASKTGRCKPCACKINAKAAHKIQRFKPESAPEEVKSLKAKKSRMRANQPAIDAFKAKKTLPDMPASQLCREYNIQNCHDCDDRSCGDNIHKPAADTIHAKSPESATLEPSSIPGVLHYKQPESIYRRALRNFGDHSQIMKTAEKAAELAAAITRYMSPKSWGGTNPLIAMTEELADVEIMCQQMRLIFGNQPIDAAKKMKLERLEKRLADE